MDDQNIDDDNTPSFTHHKTNNKILFTAIISLSLVLLLVAFLHIYVRYILHQHRTRRRAALRHLHVYTEQPKSGLDPAVIANLPLLVFKQNEGQDMAQAKDCAVCISILTDGETVRMLTNCNHHFHPQCIDHWLTFNSTCPICRTEAHPKETKLPEPPGPASPPDNAAVSDEGTLQYCAAAKVITGSSSSSRFSSFRKMLSREQIIQSRTQEDGLQVVEETSLC